MSPDRVIHWIVLLLTALLGGASYVYTRATPYFASAMEVPIDRRLDLAEGGFREIDAGDSSAVVILVHNGAPSEHSVRVERANDFLVDRVLGGQSGAHCPIVEGSSLDRVGAGMVINAVTVPARSQACLVLLGRGVNGTVRLGERSFISVGDARLHPPFILAGGELALLGGILLLTGVALGHVGRLREKMWKDLTGQGVESAGPRTS